ncbi:MAG: polyprenyl synthetase family protein [Bifidobacteriaceae bacterium]|jgi:geranylgeranyl pyrophosphate synthase|nr:polyprenyl synthetase family protein [Bifidobacteriaceae bacterium]
MKVPDQLKSEIIELMNNVSKTYFDNIQDDNIQNDISMKFGKMNRGLEIALGGLFGDRNIFKNDFIEYPNSLYDLDSKDNDKINIIITYAVAIEYLQNYLLIHDDIIDGDTSRRGEKSMWAKNSINEAIIIGDMYAAYADELFLEANKQLESYTEDKKFVAVTKLNDVYCATKTQVNTGQLFDLQLSKSDIKQTKNLFTLAYNTCIFKTSSYTYILPKFMGKALFEAFNDIKDEYNNDKLISECNHDGVIFQLNNDEESFESDVESGSCSVLIAFGICGSDDSLQNKFINLYGTKNKDKDVFNQIIQNGYELYNQREKDMEAK